MLLHHLIVIDDDNLLINSLSVDRAGAIEKLVDAVRPAGEMNLTTWQGSNVRKVLKAFDSGSLSPEEALVKLKDALSDEHDIDIYCNPIKTP